MSQLREIILKAQPDAVEEWKWMGSPVWSQAGIMVVAMPFKTSVKLGFMYGASLPDPDRLFNAELEGSQRRAIKYFEGDHIDANALTKLIHAAAARNNRARADKS